MPAGAADPERQPSCKGSCKPGGVALARSERTLHGHADFAARVQAQCQAGCVLPRGRAGRRRAAAGAGTHAWGVPSRPQSAADGLDRQIGAASTWGALLDLVLQHGEAVQAQHASRILQRLGNMRMWDTAQLRRHPGWEVLMRLVKERDLDAPTLSSLVQSLGLLGAATPRPLLARLERRAGELLSSFSMATLGSCLEGFALHAHRPERHFLAAATACMQSRLNGAPPHHVSAVLHALSRLGHQPSEAALAAAAGHLAGTLENLPLEALTKLTWALVAFGCSDLPLLEAIARRAHKAADLAWGNCARAGHSVSRPFSGTANAAVAPRELVRPCWCRSAPCALCLRLSRAAHGWALSAARLVQVYR